VPEIRVLGPVTVVAGEPRAVGGTGERALLALLALRAGTVVGADRLIEALWGERLPAHPANALQVRVSKLRRALRDVGADAGMVASRPPGYLLDVDPGEVDALAFERAVAAARRAAGDGRPDATQRYRDALALWRGPALAEFAAELWATPEIRRLDELRLAALQERIGLDVDAGRHAEVIGELEALAAQHPLQERFHEHLMLALYRSGRQAEALAAYHRARALLDEQLGLEPSAGLQQLQAAILRHDPRLAAAAATPRRTSFAGPGPTKHVVDRLRRTTNLPGRLASIVGRDTERRELAALVAAERLVTVTGAGGTGKTTLALDVARQRADDTPDGAWLVDLAAVTQGADVTDAIAGALELGRADPLPGESAHARLARQLAGRAPLIVLDNCEHVIDACAAVAEQLLEGSPGVRILTTSREALAVPGEVQYLLGPLAVPADDAAPAEVTRAAAVQLFCERAHAASRSFTCDEATAAAVGRLCRRLDGLPLAIELAAARVAALPVGEIVDRLDDRFRLLTSGRRTASARQQTLRAAVEWSHQLLSDTERLLFRRLAVFRGGWRADAAEAVCADELLAAGDVLPVLGRLVEQSLVVADHQAGRFRLLETIRHYAADRLADAGESDALGRRHAAFYEHLAHRAEPHLRGPEQATWLVRLQGDLDNFHAALGWCRDHPEDGVEIGLRLAAALGWFWYLGDHVEGRNQLREMLRVAQGGGTPTPTTRARALQAVAMVERPGACVVHPDPVCARAARESMSLFDAAGHQVGAALSRLLVAVEGAATEPVDDALEMIAQSEATLADAGHDWGMALADFVRMEVLMRDADADEAIAAGRRATARFHHVGDRWGVSAVLSHLGPNLRRTGRVPAAVEIFEESLRIAREVGLWNTVQYVAADLGLTYLMLGRDDDAERCFAEADRVAGRHGLPTGHVLAHVGRGHSTRRAGDLARARRHFDDAIRLSEGLGSPALTAAALSGLGYLEQTDGRLRHADEAHRRVLTLGRSAGAAAVVAAGLEGQAGVAVAEGDGERAGELLGAAGELRARHGVPPSGLERPDVDRIADATRRLLGADAFAAALARGRRSPAGDALPTTG
jgi:predicted ATPase/DNA-binding SARP family transcriptional activator